jgi:two-component system LytT family response regulator
MQAMKSFHFEQIDFEIIFITAYDHYAIKAFELSAIDYLLKPIEIERLKESVVKFERKIKLKDASLSYKVLVESLKTDCIKKIVVQIKGGQKIIHVKDIIAIEAKESYSLIICSDKQEFLYSKNLKHFEKLLLENKNFLRTHKSWIVNINFLESYSKSTFKINLENGVEARLSKYKKQSFESQIKL